MQLLWQKKWHSEDSSFWNLGIWDSTMLLHSDHRGSYWWLEKSFRWELFCKARGLRELIKSSRIEALNPVAHDQQVVLVTLAGRIYTIGRNLAHPLQDGVKACQTTCYSDLGCQSEPQAALCCAAEGEAFCHHTRDVRPGGGSTVGWEACEWGQGSKGEAFESL